MYLSKRENGIYYLYFEKDGKVNKVSTKAKLKSEALKFLSNFQEELKKRKESKLESIDIQEFSFEFLRYFEPAHSPKSLADYVTTFRQVEKHFGNVDLITISTNALAEYITTRIRESSVYAARKDYINLAACFNWAVRNGYLLENPCKSVPKPRVPEKLPIFFSEAEFQILLTNIDSQDMKDLALFAVNTGLRQMELLTLEWNQVNFGRKALILDNRTHITKSKKIRSVPLNDKAMAMLQRRKDKTTGSLVFTFDGKQGKQHPVSQGFKRYVRKAKLNPRLNFHSLRHTFASWLVQRGVSIYQVSKLLGHSSVNVTAIYSHLQPDDLRESVSKLMEPTN
ncbi:MAG: site-specific integrase [Bacteroidetes bacterium]|nr:site-specific integrase [Bacteroidota bacterium]